MSEESHSSIESRPIDVLDKILEAARDAGSQSYSSTEENEPSEQLATRGPSYSYYNREAVRAAETRISEALTEQEELMIDLLVEEAFNREEDIREKAEQDALGRHFLASEVKNEKAHVFDRASSDLEAVVDKVVTLLDEEEKLRQISNRLPQEPPRPFTISILEALAISLVALPLVALAAIVVLISLPIVKTLPIFSTSSSISPMGLLILTTAVVPFCLVLTVPVIRFRSRRLNDMTEWHKKWIVEEVEQARRELRLDDLEEELTFAQQAAQQALYRGVTRPLRRILNERGDPNYGTKLTLSTAPGLAEVFDPAYEISTESKGEVHRLLQSMPGGSIGIAGPRGAGKTTLLRSLCETATFSPSSRPRLSVLTSAPVEFEAREFILHIFACLCQRVVDVKQHNIGDPPKYMGSKQPSPQENKLIRTFLQYIDWNWQRPVFLLGLILLMISATLAVAISSPEESLKGVLTFLSALGIKPAPLFYLGLFVTGLGLAIPRLSRFVEGLSKQGDRESAPPKPQGTTIALQAENWLHEIRFQQSYSSGWAGTLKAPLSPISVEARVDAAMQLAENQRTLPEILDGYRQFLTEVSNEYDVVIGIDELDKIDSEETAQRFLNEIKALFGLDRCFYLVSVSENAMSNFERRGLPFRDVFDSSFDSVVRVNYMDIEKARRLLHTRVIGIPIPFLDFCYCMAGGLPRDLVRVCRDLFAVRQQNPGTETISMLAGTLIKSDIRRKLHAVSVAAKNVVAWGPEVNETLKRIHELELAVDSVDRISTNRSEFVKKYEDLLPGAEQNGALARWRSSLTALARYFQEAPGIEATDKKSQSNEQIASLKAELGVYLYYSTTLLEFFDERILSDVVLKQESYSLVLDRLAAARQYLTVSPNIAEAVITDVRAHYRKPLQS